MHDNTFICNTQSHDLMQSNLLDETSIPLHANLLENLLSWQSYENVISHVDKSCLSGVPHLLLRDCYILPG